MTFSTLLSPLYPLIQFFGLMFADTGADEPDTPDQPPAAEHTDLNGQDDTPNPDEPEGDEPDVPDDEEDQSAEAIVRRNAAQKIGAQGQAMRADDLALISLLAEAPTKAPRVIAMLKEENPQQAERLARLFEKGGDDLADKLKNADPIVRETLQGLTTELRALSSKTDAQYAANEKRVYLNWQREKASYLSPKSPEGQTPMGKRLREQFRTALDLFPSDAPLTEDILEDALVVAKRRSGWQDKTVKQAVDKQAVEQAARARAAGAANGGTGLSKDQAPNADPRIAAMFGRKTPEQLAKIAQYKKQGGFK